jgi:cytochrome c
MSRLEITMSHPHALSLALLLSAIIVPAAQAEGDASRGKALFGRCVACHAATADNKIGPGLAGVFGRPAGSAPNFHYSKAMIDYAKRWDDQTLDTYLAAPTKAVPGTTMVVSVPGPSDRVDIIAHLKTLDAH